MFSKCIKISQSFEISTLNITYYEASANITPTKGY